VATRPYVFVNMAMTADGKIDTVERQGARISGEADTARVDALRAGADAIMVGGHTLISEDPRLTVRDAGLVDRRVAHGLPAQPVKVGVVSYLSLQGPPSISGEGAFLRAGGGRVVVFTSDRTAPDVVAALERQGAEVLVMGAERVDLARALKTLADRGVERLMVEGGSTIVAALLDDGLVDELQLTIAPLVFGGATAPTPVGGPGRSRASALRLRLAESSTSPDGDVVLRYLVGAGAGA
jgi:2,5-diamino-6-(ribosylamino)-4(3H)-pyrimidinone 5'-phosphate reductase